MDERARRRLYIGIYTRACMCRWTQHIHRYVRTCLCIHSVEGLLSDVTGQFGPNPLAVHSCETSHLEKTVSFLLSCKEDVSATQK